MVSDSSKTGYGACFGKKYLYGTFPISWQSFDIQVLELYPIFLLVHMFFTQLSNHHVIFHCDNLAIVHTINNMTSKCKPVMYLLRPMILIFLKHNIIFKAVHIPGARNLICDALSRQKAPWDLLAQAGIDYSPTPVPSLLRPHNFSVSSTSS